MNNEIAQFLNSVIVECLDHKHCNSYPFRDKIVGECIWERPPYLWDTDKMKEMIERCE